MRKPLWELTFTRRMVHVILVFKPHTNQAKESHTRINATEKSLTQRTADLCTLRTGAPDLLLPLARFGSLWLSGSECMCFDARKLN